MRSPVLEYDEVVHKIYTAAAGLTPWVEPLRRIADAFDAWVIHFHGVDKRGGHMMFSYEAGPAPPEAGIDYIRTYHRIDPRIALIATWPTHQWLACQEHFDDEFVSRDPFYQEYLIPYGARYVFGAKVFEDESSVVALGHLSKAGKPPLGPAERELFARIGRHLGDAFAIQRRLRSLTDTNALGFALLDRLKQPVILVDADRRITFASEAARRLLDRADVLYDHGGALVCRDADSDLELTLAMRDLALAPINSNLLDSSPLERRSLRLRRVGQGHTIAGALLALRPRSVMGAFGQAPQALLTIYEPSAAHEVDPFLLATTFDLTPAEARVAARLASGMSLKEVARSHGVTLATVRTQLATVFEKTGTKRQADLVRLIHAAQAI